MTVMDSAPTAVAALSRGTTVKTARSNSSRRPAKPRAAESPPPERFSRPTVSVCIPVYNSEDTIARSISSVLEQSYQDFECVVVDNDSSDSTVKRVRAFKDDRIRIVRNPTNIGMVGNHNECLRQARGELLQFVHGDDWLLPNCLARMVRTFDNPAVGFAFAPRHVETVNEEWKTRYGQLHSVLEPLAPVNDGSGVGAQIPGGRGQRQPNRRADLRDVPA